MESIRVTCKYEQTRAGIRGLVEELGVEFGPNWDHDYVIEQLHLRVLRTLKRSIGDVEFDDGSLERV